MNRPLMTEHLGHKEAAKVFGLAILGVGLLVGPLVGANASSRDLGAAMEFAWCPNGAREDGGRVVCGTADDRTPLGARAELLMGVPIDLNHAVASDLELVPGIGPRIAQRIVADRERVGPFREVGAVRRVKGVGPVLAKRLAHYAVVAGRDAADRDSATPSKASDPGSIGRR